jgi:PAS domain S-box-containing protein
MSGSDSQLCEQHIPPVKCGFGFLRGGCVPLICFLLLAAVTAFSQTPPAPKTIRVVMDNNYPPFVFQDTDGKLEGILIDQWRLWEQKTGIQVEIHAMDWGEAVQRMKAGEFDVIDTIFETAERSHYLDFTKPYAQIKISIFFTKDISGITDLASLNGFPVAAKSGDADAAMLRQNGVTNLLLLNNYEHIVTAAKDHKVNVFIMDEPPAFYFLNKLGIENQFRHSPPVSTGAFHRAVKKGNTAMLKLVVDGFARIAPDELQAIDQKWRGAELGGPDLKRLGYAGAAGLVLISLLIAWNWSLNQKVRRRTADLKQSEELFRQLAENIKEVFWLSDLKKNQLIYVSPAYEKIWGRPVETVYADAMAWLDAVHPEDRERVRQAVLARQMEGTSDEEYRILRPDHSVRWVRDRAFPVRNAAGDIYRVAGIAKDFTERKQRDEANAREQARFKLIFETVPIGIALHTFHPDGQSTRIVNQAHLRISGLTREQHDEPGIYARITHPEDRVIQDRFNEQVRAGGLKQYSLEKRYLHAAGKIVWVNFSYQRETYPDGTTEELTTVVDITQSKALEEQFRQSQKMDAIGQLAGGVAHDFNNILAVIQMQAGMLRAERNLPATEMDFAEEIEKAAGRAANLTRQLLMFGRKQALQARDLELTEVVNHITTMLQRILGEDVRMQLKFAPQPLFINADAGMMDQILMNLTVNSRQAMPNGGTLVIETSGVRFDAATAAQTPQARPGAFACLSVSDNGEGIAPEILPHIFEPFFTTKDVGKGSGLGLATVFGIVQQHQGWINVYSEPGQGTTFRVYLPQLDRPAKLPSAPPAPSPARGGKETILVVEDDPALRGVIRSSLARLGYQIIEAASGVQALEAWHQKRGEIPLLLTDMLMPDGMNGKELAEKLLQKNPKLKVIYISGYSADLAGEDLVLIEGVNFLAKPFEIQKLAKTIRERLDND